jgi:ComF family protein
MQFRLEAILVVGSSAQYTQRPMDFLRSLFLHALPTACIVCARFQTAVLCPACSLFLGKHSLFQCPTCARCSIADKACYGASGQCHTCLKTPPAFDETHCLDRYEAVLQGAIHALKYQRRLAVADGLALAWNQFAMPRLQNTSADVLLPVPLSTTKLSRRGFNQSWEIARRLRLPQSLMPIANALGRHHAPEDQVHHNRHDRQLALQNAFYMNPGAIQWIQGKSIIVFDDVMTTGSTLHEIATLLKSNGARSVTNWVVLRTLGPQSNLHLGSN